MRDIKFRAWDGEKMRQVFGLTPITVCYEEESRHPVTYRSREGIEVMQSASLKDRNGKEIYENDLVQVWGKYDNSYAMGQVIWHEDMAGFGIGFNDEEPLCTIGQHVEVIGNIYENPELLSKEA